MKSELPERLQWLARVGRGVTEGVAAGCPCAESLDVHSQTQNLQSLPGPNSSQHSQRRGIHAGERASGTGELFGWAGNGCNNLIAFAGCTDLAEWAVGRLQSALCQDRPWL